MNESNGVAWYVRAKGRYQGRYRDAAGKVRSAGYGEDPDEALEKAIAKRRESVDGSGDPLVAFLRLPPPVSRGVF